MSTATGMPIRSVSFLHYSEAMERYRSDRLVDAWVVVLLSAAVVAAVAIGSAACRRGVPIMDAGDPPSTVDGTISGRLTSAADNTQVAGRKVEAINLVTGERRDTTTSARGAFSLKVPPGKYRLSVELREGESLARPPGTIDINKSDLDHDVEIAITPAVARPRQSDSMRSSDGLGAPIA